MEFSEFTRKNRRRIKLNLLGLCGREAVKNITDIALAIAPKNYSGTISELEKEARRMTRYGHIYYKENKFIFFTPDITNTSEESYHIRLVKVSDMKSSEETE